MDSNIFESLIAEDGTLSDRFLLSKEALFTGRNGKEVIRFYINTDSGRRSYIFKPLTNPDTLGRELWLYQHVLPLIPVRIPRLLAHAGQAVPAEHYWSIYEDMGPLEPVFEHDALIKAAEIIPYWHRIPMETIPPDYRGHTPAVVSILGYVTLNFVRLSAILSGLSGSALAVHELQERIRSLDGAFQTELSVSHGDYYGHNISLINHELIVLDWEYAHVNSVYWDLYNLLDITSSRYRKPAISKATRSDVLDAYIHARQAAAKDLSDNIFKSSYYLYSAIHSAWILLMIDRDISAGDLDPAALKAQQRETWPALLDCLEQYNEVARS